MEKFNYLNLWVVQANINSTNQVNESKSNKKLNEQQYDSSCPNCKVNLDDYIDRCKIPCKDCRDPAWKCPQDIGKNKQLINNFLG